MSKPKHTPGPWILGATEETIFIITEQSEAIVAQIEAQKVGPEEAFKELGDARLIAAAPDLLESVEILVEWLERWQQMIEDELANCQPSLEHKLKRDTAHYGSMIKIGKYAIDKARGEN